MTNKDKYLKEGVSVEEFVENMFSCEHIEVYGGIKYINRGSMSYWLEKECKPTLTEDERVILKNIEKEYTHIGRGDETYRIVLYIKSKDDFKHCWCFYNHLFQFIKEGEEYSIEELLK